MFGRLPGINHPWFGLTGSTTSLLESLGRYTLGRHALFGIIRGDFSTADKERAGVARLKEYLTANTWPDVRRDPFVDNEVVEKMRREYTPYYYLWGHPKTQDIIARMNDLGVTVDAESHEIYPL